MFKNRRLSLLLVILLIVSLFLNPLGNTVSAAELTPLEKYDALVAKGIFTGMNTAGDAALDQNMNRAQFARVAALILGLEGIGVPDTKVVTEKPFSDVELGLWYVEEIAAAKEAGIFVGNPDGTFNPGGDVTVQQMAKVVVKILDLEPVEDAKVEGAADWAAGYIQALKYANIDFPTDYTKAATREQLVSLSYQVDQTVAENKKVEDEKNEQKDNQNQPIINETPVSSNLSIVNVKHIGAKILKVTFNQKTNSEIRIEVSLNDTPVAFQVTSNDAYSYILTFTENIQDGTYKITAINTNTGNTISTTKLTTLSERIAKINFVSSSDTISLSETVVIPINFINQFGEIVKDISNVEVTTTPYSSYYDSNRKAVIVNTSTANKNDRVSISVKHTSSQISVQKFYTVGDSPIVTNIKIYGSMRGTDGQQVSQVNWNKNYHVNFDLYDQYGSTLLSSMPLLSDHFNTNISPYSDKFSFGTVEAALSNEPGFLSLPITLLSSNIAEDYTLTMAAGNSGSSTVNFHVSEGNTPKLPEVIESTSPSKVGESYYGSIVATGGTGANTYTVDSGQLPPGITLNPNTGELTGAPSSSGTFTFTIRVTDSESLVSTMQYTMTIEAPAILLHLISYTDKIVLTVPGQKEALTIMAIYDDYSNLDVTNMAQYTSSNDSVATVSNTGVVTMVARGTANITVTYNGKTLDVPVTVTEGVERQLEFITAGLGSYGIRVGMQTNIYVTAFFDSGEPETVTSLVTFEIDDPKLVEIDANFFLTALKPGFPKIKVTYLSKEYIIDDLRILE